MINNFVFHLPKDSNDMIKTFKLNKVLSNSRTSIYQNNNVRVSIDSNVVRVLLFDENNINLLEKIRAYFYGEQYEKL